MDLAKLIQPQWIFRSESNGEWDVYHYSINAAVAIDVQLASETSNAIEAIRALMGVMLKRHVEDEDQSSNPTVSEIAEFTDEDINRFAREFLENNQSLEPDAKIEKREGQTDAEYLLKVLEAENKEQSAKMADMFAGLRGSLGGLLGSKNHGIRSVSEELLKQSEGLESIYGPKLSDWEPSPALYEPIPIMPNPAHETNERLRDMSERLENLVGFGENALRIMNGLQVAAAEFLENFSAEAEKNSKAAKKAIWVGVCAILLSVLQIAYTEFWRVPQDTVAMDKALESIRVEIDELQAAIGTDLGASQAALERVSEAVVDAAQSTGGANTELLKAIEQLLRQQQARDRSILEALDAIIPPVKAQAE